MRKIRVLSTILLIIFIITWPIYFFTHTPIKKDKNKETVDEEKSQWKGVIRLWDFPRLNINTGSRYSWIMSKIRKFEKENPGVFIEFEPIDWKKGPIKLEVGLQTGNLPDIAPVGTDPLFMTKEVLEPLDSFLTKSEINKFKPQALKAVKYNGKIWGMPFMMTTYAMYLNLELFRQRGVEPPIDGNWTYEEFIDKMKKLTYDSDGDGKIDYYGFVSFIEPNYYNIWGIILSDGAEIIDNNGQYVFYGEKALSGLQKLVDLKKKYKVTPEDFGLYDENTAWDMFYNKKKVAVYPTGSWAVRVLQKLYEKGKGFEFTVANYPIGDRRIPISFNNSVSAYAIFKQENEEKLKMCVKFLKFLVNNDNQRELEKLGVFPVKKGIKGMYLYDEKMKRVEDIISYTKTIPRHGKWKKIDRILQNQVRLAVIGKKTSSKALEDAKKQVYQILNTK
ncbi:ABC transporter substrate-binding protein [Thermohalobacter berrensis]|uniref:ABC transporter substrate-binding protein n=1 Tax=Thermohalobacter berrensis TaxID=99594 RepID=A0A419SXX1_9FIRM|nr:sugar ABC transporter substrate-binding protein [Thermohalobacter berrensis]RKD30113.1 ABC transporter substrate-binding protein [Thermohalobacter berrensis]